MYNQHQELEKLLNIGNLEYKVSYNEDNFSPSVLSKEELHLHSCYEVYLNISGDVSFLINGDIVKIAPDTIIFSKPGEVHHCICNNECIHKHFCLWFSSDDKSFLDYINAIKSVIVLKEEKAFYLKELLQNLNEDSEKENNFSNLLSFLQILDILKAGKAEKTTYVTNMPETLKEIIRYIDLKFTEIKNINEILESYHISHSTLNRWFRQYLNLSPLEFLQAKKLAYAKKLLEEGKSVTDAGYYSGFCDSAYFVLTFKKQFGTTPLKYKKSVESKC